MEVDPYFANSNEWAVILGGSSGIGLACAHKLASEGLNIWIFHRDRKKDLPAFEKAMEEMRSKGVEVLNSNVDATDEKHIISSVKMIQDRKNNKVKIKLLLHSISRGNINSLLNLSLSDLNQTMNAMAFSLHIWFRNLFNAGLFTNKSIVIGLTSEGSIRSVEGYAAVSAAKASLEALGRSIAIEYGASGIRCILLMPGVCDTPSLRLIPGYEKLKANALNRNPSGRLTTPEDVANAVYLMCREEAAWINGAVIPVDGGEIIQ
jgi:enoyl-[acyl-carrier protein] reductase I